MAFLMQKLKLQKFASFILKTHSGCLSTAAIPEPDRNPDIRHTKVKLFIVAKLDSCVTMQLNTNIMNIIYY